ncbi:MAG: ATP-binding protein, partial [Nitrososphaerota archaeon]|nr:ATP-binding protein [Nitrososphaerota archaeon]
NVDSLARDMGRSKRTILDAVQYMTDSYAVRVLRNHRPSTQSSSRKLKRVYPYHFCQVSNEDVEEPKLQECVAASLLDARAYWREGQEEVDFVVNGAPVEVKWKKLISDADYRHLGHFLKKYDVPTGYMVSKSESRVRKVDGHSILTIPMWRLGEAGGLNGLSGTAALSRGRTERD